MYLPNCFGFLLFVLHDLPLATGQSQLICSSESVAAQAGENVILPCRLDPPISASSRTVEWTRPGLDPEYIHVHQDGRLVYQSQNPLYSYRTTLFVDQLVNGNVSLKIFNVKMSDAGKYKCFLPSLWKEAFIQLTVDDFSVTSSSCTAAAIMSVLFGLMFILAVVLFVWKWRRDKLRGEKNTSKISSEHKHLMKDVKLMEDLDKKKAKLDEDLKKKEEEQKDLTQVIGALKEMTKELEKQKEQITKQMQESERAVEENEKKLNSVDKEVTEKEGDKTVNRAQGYLKLKELMTEANWKLKERLKDHQELHINIDKIMKKTCDEVVRITEKKNEVENSMKQIKQQLQERESQREEMI